MKTIYKRLMLSMLSGVLALSILCTIFVGVVANAQPIDPSKMMTWGDYLTAVATQKRAEWNWSTPPAGTPVWDGSIAPSSPATVMEGTKTVYLIYTPQELYWTRQHGNDAAISKFANAEIRLMRDLDMGGRSGRAWVPYSVDFKGEFNGQGYTMYNLYVNRPASEYNGLFSYTGTASNIHDLRMVTPKVYGQKHNAALVGMDYGVVRDVCVEKAWIEANLDPSIPAQGNDWTCGIIGEINSFSTYSGLVAVDCVMYGKDHVGATAGQVRSIQNSYATGCTIISTGFHSGGFISCTDFLVSIKNCFSDCEVFGTRDTGAFMGYSTNSGSASVNTRLIENCFAQGSVEGVTTIGGFSAGFKGFGSGGITVSNCYSTAIVGMRNGGTNIGSFVGATTDKVTFRNSYAAGEVGGLEGNNMIGGFIGLPDAATSFINCYYDKQTTAMRETASGFGNPAGITGLLTNSVKGGNGFKMTGTALTGFDPGIWKFEDQLYPQLHIFADAGSTVFADNTMLYKQNRAAGAAYSAASVATPMLEPWEVVPYDTTYDTVRDITMDFPLSRNANHIITWSNEGSSGAVETGKTVLTQSSDGYTEHVNTVGIEWLYATHTATISGVSVTAVRPLRVIPTRSLYAGVDQTKKTGEYYNNWEDVSLIDSTALGLSRYLQGTGSIAPKVGEDAKILVENGSVPAYAKNSPTITEQNNTKYDYFASATVLNSFNGYRVLPNQYGGKTFTIAYTWLLTDGRFLTDSKRLVVSAVLIKMHIRQVVIGHNTSAIPLPKNGYVNMSNLNLQGSEVAMFSAICNSGEGDPDYTDFTFGITAPIENQFIIVPIIPQYYRYMGNVVSYTDGTASDTDVDWDYNINVNYSSKKEAWITIYITPTTDNPAYFEWDDALNQFGEIE